MKNQEAFFSLQFLVIMACILACKGFSHYLFFLLFLLLFCQNFLRYRWFGFVFFLEESSWNEFSVAHVFFILFFWQMKLEFDISMENWEIFPHFGKTKKNIEISDVPGALKWWLQGDETIIIRMHILHKGCIKILYENYFHTLNHKKFSTISHRRSLEGGLSISHL